MLLIFYYVIVLFVAILAWPYTYGIKGWARLPWLLLGVVVVVLPLFLPLRTAFYYGLLGNFTVFAWSADTYMGKQDRRSRAFLGAVFLIPLPTLWRWPLESWLGALLVPTLGNTLISGIAWGFSRAYIRAIASGERTVQEEWLLEQHGGRTFLITLAYGLWLGLTKGGAFWLSPLCAVFLCTSLFVGYDLRERAMTERGWKRFLRNIVADTTLVPVAILGLNAATAWIVFKAGFYDLYRGIAEFNVKEVALSLAALSAGTLLVQSMGAFLEYENAHSWRERDKAK